MREVILAGLMVCLFAGCSGGGGHTSVRYVGDATVPLLAVSQAEAEVAEQDEPLAPVAIGESMRTVSLSAGCGIAGAPGDWIVEVDTLDLGLRTARLHVQVSCRGDTPAALVLSFHGQGRTAAEQDEYTGLATLSEEAGFLLVTPEGAGSPSGWDIYGVYNENGIDDLAFTRQVLAAMSEAYCVDLDRVYATGHSNGAEMAAQLACYGPELAAIAPVSGAVYQGCGGMPVPVISFHGTWDFNVPFAQAPESMLQWAWHNGCDGEFADEPVSDSVIVRTYTGCPQGAEVVLYIIEGGGHTWPNSLDNTFGAGPTTHEIDANSLIWDFFQSHPRRSFAEFAGRLVAIPNRPAYESSGRGETTGEVGAGEPTANAQTPEFTPTLDPAREITIAPGGTLEPAATETPAPGAGT